MQYEKPVMEIMLLGKEDVITLSVGIGDGDNVDGDVGGWS